MSSWGSTRYSSACSPSSISASAQLHHPLGINLFIVSGIAQVPMDRIIRELWPVLLVLLLDLAIFVTFPDIVMFLPNLMSG